MTDGSPRIITGLTPDAVATDGARIVLEAIAVARHAQRTADIALAGGSTPAALYRRLSRQIDDFDDIRLWLGDERMVPRDTPDANARMVTETLLAHHPGSGADASLQRVATDRTAKDAAREYADWLRDRIDHTRDGVPILDLVILGIGEDGHTASLFPGRPELTPGVPDPLVVAVHDAPKPPPTRVSLTMGIINAARARLIVATGPEKTAALRHLVDGRADPRWPITLVTPNQTMIVTDQSL